MHETMAAYFAGEKHAGLLLAFIGLGIGAGAAALFRAGAEHRPFAITLVLWALLELAVGVGLFLKTDPQLAGLSQLLTDTPVAFYASEQPRMTKVQRNFAVLETVWLVVLVATAAVAIWQKESPLRSGIALGILVNVTVMLAFDIIAERRGRVYFDALTDNQPQALHSPS